MALESSSLGGRVREVRTRLALTQSEFASRLRTRKGKRPDTALVSRWERDVTEPSLYYMRQIAELGGITVDELWAIGAAA